MTLPEKNRVVRCPTCTGDSLYSPSNPYRPFCSAVCKNRDIGAWANEDFKVPTHESSDEWSLENDAKLP